MIKTAILIVDDQPEILNTLRRIFRKEYDVYTSSRAADAASAGPKAESRSAERMSNRAGNRPDPLREFWISDDSYFLIMGTSFPVCSSSSYQIPARVGYGKNETE